MSNVGLIVGGVGAAVAVTFVFWRPWAGSEGPGSSEGDASAAEPVVEAAFTGNGLALRGRF